MEGEITRRAGGLSNLLFGNFTDAKLLAVNSGIFGLVIFSLLSMIFIYYFFEKTQSPELLFVFFFAASFSPEALRLVLPLGRVYEIPSMYYLTAYRFILFARYFGIFSLFAIMINTRTFTGFQNS
jgi:hypothetical protein